MKKNKKSTGRKNGKLLLLSNPHHRGRRKMAEANLIGKLTLKGMGCRPQKVTAIDGEKAKLALAHIIGKAQEVRYQDDKSGSGTIHTFFVGNFEGVNLETGDVYHSGKLFLPRGISELVEAAIKEAQKHDKNASISFAFELRSVKANNPIGYSYEARALKKPEQEDELGELRKLLAAPKTQHTEARAS